MGKKTDDPQKKKKTKGKTSKKAARGDDSDDGNLGKLRRDFKKEQAADRRRRRNSAKRAEATSALNAAAAAVAQQQAVAAAAQPQAAPDQAKPPAEAKPKDAAPSAVKCLDAMATAVQKYARSMMHAEVTAETAYLMANLTTEVINRVIDHAIKLGMQGMGTPERPLDALAVHAGARSIITDDNLTLVLLFRTASAIAAERGTQDESNAALGMFIESRQAGSSDQAAATTDAGVVNE